MQTSIGELLKHMAEELSDRVAGINARWEQLIAERPDRAVLSQGGLETFRRNLTGATTSVLADLRGGSLSVLQAAEHASIAQAWKAMESPTLWAALECLRTAILDEALHSCPDLDVASGIQLANRISDSLTHSMVSNFEARLGQSNIALEEAHRQVQSADERRIRITRMMSHELRNGLNALTAAVDMMAEDDDPELRQESIGICRHTLAELTALLRDLTDYSSLITGRVKLSTEPVDLLELLEEIRYEWAVVADREHVQLTAESVPGNATIDRRVVRKIAGFLLDNAIRTARRKGNHVHLQFASRGDGTWNLIVKDNGPGIPEDKIPEAFIEFARIDPGASAAGAGLSLALAKGYTELIGGTISVRSALGEGSEFTATLPSSPTNSNIH